MNLKKQLRAHIKKAYIPDMTTTIIEQLSYSNTLEDKVINKRTSFVFQFSAFLVLLLGVSVFSYQQTSSQIYAFSEYEEVLGISAGFIDTYLEMNEEDNLPQTISLKDQLEIDVEISYMITYMRMVENLVITQNHIIQRRNIDSVKEKYVVTFDKINQSQQSFEMDVEKRYKNFNQDVFEFEAIFHHIKLTGYTEFNDLKHQLHLSAQTETQQFSIHYDNLDKEFSVTIMSEGRDDIHFRYRLIRNNLNQPVVILYYSRDEKDMDLIITYLPVRKKIDVSYRISFQEMQSSGNFEITFLIDQGIVLMVTGETDTGERFQYQFQRNQHFLDKIQ